MFDNTIMKGDTKKLYQNVNVSKPKKFGNQNTNSINVIVNPNDADDEGEGTNIPTSKIAQLNALNKQGMSPMDMNYIQQEALRQGEPIDGQTINESNQELNDAEDLRTLQQGAVEQIQERVMEGEAQEAMAGLSRLQSDVLNNVRYQVEKDENDAEREVQQEQMEFMNRYYEEDVEAFQREQEGLRAQLLEQQENTRMINEDMMARQQDFEEERQREREYSREGTLKEMKELEDEMARMTGVMNTHLAEDEVEEGFNTPQNQLTPPPPEQYTSPLMETFEQMKRDRSPEARKKLVTRAQRGFGPTARFDKAGIENFLNPPRRE